MKGLETFRLGVWDYLGFIGYFAILSLICLWAGRRRKQRSDDYFLAGRSLPWYVVGCSFIASNISSEHFIGMIGAAFLVGLPVAMFEWGNVLTFSILIWFFIPFLIASKVFTTAEFMERRFNFALRECFAGVTVITNILAFLAGVLYGGGLAIQKLFGLDLYTSIGIVGAVAGLWVVYGGLISAAWADVFTILVMLAGGAMVTGLGLAELAGPGGSLADGVRELFDRNRAADGPWAEAVRAVAPHLTGGGNYNRLSVIQPASHILVPWTGLIFIVFTVSIWYNVINQFMIQRVLAARNMYHARMGIVLAGYMKIILPVIVVVPGLILFARFPEIMLLPFEQVRTEADKGYVHMLQELIPVGLRGIFLAALFGAIQSTVQAVLNSTATIFTMDLYKPLVRPRAADGELILVGRLSTVAALLIALVIGGFIEGRGLFEYIQTLYAFFAPPFGAVFLLGILFRRINGTGATAAVFAGFAFAITLKLYAGCSPTAPHWIRPFMNQAMFTWAFCVAVCVLVSLLTAPPRPEQVTDQLTLNWRRLNITDQLGDRWYRHVLLWWGLFVIIVVGLIGLFSGRWF